MKKRVAKAEVPPKRYPKGTIGALRECVGLLTHEEAEALLEAVREIRREDREADGCT
jgi:hypothetical protein